VVNKIGEDMNVYIKAAILTILVFFSGLILGIWLDQYRLQDVKKRITSLDVSWNDARLLYTYFQKIEKDYCELAFEQNLAYNHKIYKEGLEIELAEKTNRFTPELQEEKRRYVLLQTQFWLNSIELKEKCNFTYNNVVYLYKQHNLTRDEVIDQKTQASILLDLKERCGNKIMLIPLAADLNLTIIDAIKNQYKIEKYPAIIVDNIVFQGVTTLEKINEVTKC